MVTPAVKKIHEQVWKIVEGYWERNTVMGHGVDHAHRCYSHAIQIARSEGVDPLPIGVACYLMDVGLSPEKGRVDHVLRSLEIATRVLQMIPELEHVKDLIMSAILYHESDDYVPDNTSIEVLTVRDSDTLDRLGFTGIRMTLTYGKWVSRPLYNPEDPFCLQRPIQIDGFTLDYIKYLFLLANRLITPTAKAIGSYKVNEMNTFCQSFKSLYDRIQPITYDDAYNLLGELECIGE